MKNEGLVTLVVICLIIILVILVIFVFPLFDFNLNRGEMCNYGDTDKQYIGKSKEQCSTIRFVCESGSEYFSDECGCGCIKRTDILEKHYCDSPRPEVCTKIYNPVCGWFDSEKIQCIKYPCASSYGNSCDACGNVNVLYWTEGICPA